MKTSIDAAGRIVVPKALRVALGFKEGQALDLRVVGGTLEVEAAPTPMKLVKRGKGVVAEPASKLPTLTADEVREALESVRR